MLPTPYFELNEQHLARVDAVLNQVCSLAVNYHKAQTNVEVSCQAAYPLEQPLTIIMSALRTC
ncbi:hypothetical protein T12_3610 [Trichinella patagoniensis]|uniref:Uncharacterized protein n=1 Tax=Trichinella patagoniensis TaxID=990121 RepID=A0A0V0YZL3_9BILA|nr:hypothetical protein T12_3610 [Trichinella patagoniensis]